MLLLAIVLTVIASSSSNIGKAFQKEASRHLPPLNVGDAKVVEQVASNCCENSIRIRTHIPDAGEGRPVPRLCWIRVAVSHHFLYPSPVQYTNSSTWIAGFLMDLGGGAVQTLAFALAPVSLLQPISGIGLAGLALYSHFIANEKLKQDEWVAVGVAGLGTIGLGVSSAADAPSHHAVSFLRMLTVLVATGVFVIQKLADVRERIGNKNKKLVAAMFGASRVLGSQSPSPVPHATVPHATVRSRIPIGLQAGGMFGLSASTVRTGFIMSNHRWTWAPFGVMCGVLMSSYGFVLQTGGLKEGSAVIVCTCLAVSSMVVGVVTGILGLGEPVPLTFTSMWVRLASWTCILYGVVVLSGATRQVHELLAYGLDYVPANVWGLLPEHVAIKVKNWQSFARADGGDRSGPLSPKTSERISRTRSFD